MNTLSFVDAVNFFNSVGATELPYDLPFHVEYPNKSVSRDAELFRGNVWYFYNKSDKYCIASFNDGDNVWEEYLDFNGDIITYEHTRGNGPLEISEAINNGSITSKDFMVYLQKYVDNLGIKGPCKTYINRINAAKTALAK